MLLQSSKLLVHQLITTFHKITPQFRLNSGVHALPFYCKLRKEFDKKDLNLTWTMKAVDSQRVRIAHIIYFIHNAVNLIVKPPD